MNQTNTKSNPASTPKTTEQGSQKVTFNWPIVGFLLLMTGIPGIPAFFLIAIVLMGPGAIEGVSNALNQFHFDTPMAAVVHGGSGILFFLSMPFQFSPALRSGGAKWHKRGGYLALFSGYLMALSGIWMHHVLTPEEFGPRYVVLVLVAVGMCVAFSVALQRIIKRDISSHKAWMCRAVAISLAVVTPIFIEIPVYLVFTQLDGAAVNVSQIMHDYGRLIGLIVNLAVVEWGLKRQPVPVTPDKLVHAANA